jgi:isopentenyl diphosphate isomerase/L-lactate dehydrogenase-like FMN-dependent dehydrogenase
VWNYVMGAAESETTMRRNRQALEALALRPRVLRDVSKVDTTTTLLGHLLRIPVVLAPIGSLATIVPEGGLAVARAAHTAGVLPFVSSVAEPGVEEIAASTDGPKICQLYVRGDEAWVEQLIERVLASGYSGLALTVDSAYYGRRERQLTGWRPPSQRDGGDPDRIWQARLTWEWMAKMIDAAGVPFVVKGIQTAEDAALALEHGVSAIYISNHGGRQLDHADATIATLPEVVEVVAGRAQIIVDGGFMRGTDIIKALALGADAVGLGRGQALALAAGGTELLVRLLELLEEELRTTMGLLGITRVDELRPSHVKAVAPLGGADR